MRFPTGRLFELGSFSSYGAAASPANGEEHSPLSRSILSRRATPRRTAIGLVGVRDQASCLVVPSCCAEVEPRSSRHGRKSNEHNADCPAASQNGAPGRQHNGHVPVWKPYGPRRRRRRTPPDGSTRLVGNPVFIPLSRTRENGISSRRVSSSPLGVVRLTRLRTRGRSRATRSVAVAVVHGVISRRRRRRRVF